MITLAALSIQYTVKKRKNMAEKYFCKYCRQSFPSVQSLTQNWCQKNPAGKSGKHHVLYEGGEKAQYTCKWCGQKFTSLQSLTHNWCTKNPAGKSGQPHEAAL
jgi:DNA-directed RNA polymerase subunit RPC12/RpoP